MPAATLPPRRQFLRRSLCCGLAAGLGLRAAPAASGEPLVLVSPDFPALISGQGPDAPGPLGEFLILLGERAGLDLHPHFYPFARATLMARSGPRVLMAPLARTPERELQYRWLLPLFTQRYALIGPRSRWPAGIQEAAARKAKVLTLRGAMTVDSLQKQGFRNLAQEANYDNILRRLTEGSADLLYGAVPVVMAALRAAGRDPQDWVVGPGYDHTEIWLVGSPDLQDQELQPLLEAFEKLKREGEHQRLLQRIGVLQGPGGL